VENRNALRLWRAYLGVEVDCCVPFISINVRITIREPSPYSPKASKRLFLSQRYSAITYELNKCIKIFRNKYNERVRQRVKVRRK
jgi:hypothetical protein